MTTIDNDVLPGGVREAARRLGIGVRQAYRAAARGEIPALKIGGRYVVPRVAFERFLADAARPGVSR